MDWEYKPMFLKKVRCTVLAALLLLAFHTSCQGPFTYETHPVIWVSSYLLTFSSSEVGPNPSPQTLQIKNSGVQNLTYTIADDAGWLTINPTSGTSTGQVLEHLISVDKTGLASKSDPYTARITINSTQACNNPQQVSVSLSLSKEPPPEISVTPKDVRFVAIVGGQSPPQQTIRVRNSGQGTLNYTLSEDANWLDVNPDSGTSTGSENIHSLTVNTAGLGTGTYTATMNVVDANAVNSPQVVNVTLEIGTSLPPTIAVDPDILRFSARVGGSNPASQKIKVRNSGQGTLNYAVSDDAAWLDVTPAGGSSTGQEVSHTVSASIAGLSNGTYSGLITISSPNATNSPQTVAVTLEIGQIPTNNQISISCSPTSGKTGATIDFPISILGNTQEIKAFGMDVTFDTTVFEFVRVDPGNLTSTWGAGFAGFLRSPGLVKIGGYGGTVSIPVGSSGTLAVLKLRVTCGTCIDGKQSQVCIGSFTDDIVGMTMAPGCATFTYRK
jgi:hypothetical protein